MKRHNTYNYYTQAQQTKVHKEISNNQIKFGFYQKATALNFSYLLL